MLVFERRLIQAQISLVRCVPYSPALSLAAFVRVSFCTETI